MPVNPTCPGVYMEEIPRGVRTTTGVSTSIAAFIAEKNGDDGTCERNGRWSDVAAVPESNENYEIEAIDAGTVVVPGTAQPGAVGIVDTPGNIRSHA